MKLLLIEDDRAIAFALSQALSSSYTVDVARTGLGGLHKIENELYDIVILDLSLPDMTGLDVCQRIRNISKNLPVLILTGENNVMQKISVLDSGADDYLTKPFSLGELKVRLRVLVRRANTDNSPVTNIVVGDLILNTANHKVSRAGLDIDLRRKEFTLLECLMQHSGSVVSREALTRYAWQVTENPWTNTIDVHIKYLRDKIDRPFGSSMIKTIHGLGYKIEPALTYVPLPAEVT